MSDLADPLEPKTRKHRSRAGAVLPERSYPSLRTIGALILREMSTRYGRNPGGYIWALIEPLGTIILLSVGFSLLIRTPSLGNSFIFFYATGFLPFHSYQQISLFVARAIQFSRPLLFYPAVTWIDSVIARFVLNALTSILVMYLIFVGLFLVSDNQVIIEMPPILLSILLALALGFGVGVLNCALIGLLPTWDLIWSIVTRPLFLASGIFYLYEDLPVQVREILWYNPLIHITGLMRSGFFVTYEPEDLSKSYVLAVSLICTATGLMLLKRHHRKILQDG